MHEQANLKPCSPKSTFQHCSLMRNWLIWFGRLGMRGLLSEQSIPWDREQTDSLTQGIIEAGPRYHLILHLFRRPSLRGPWDGRRTQPTDCHPALDTSESAVLPKYSSEGFYCSFPGDPARLGAMLSWLGIIVGALKLAIRTRQALALRTWLCARSWC